MTRWDLPLFVVIEEDVNVPILQIWEVLGGNPASGDGKKTVVRPNAATTLKPATQSNHLYELDKTTSSIVAQILAWTKDHEGEGGGEVSVDTTPASVVGKLDSTTEEDNAIVELPANGVTLPMLQRMRRQFMSLNRQHTHLDKNRVGPLFVDYLNDQFSLA